MKRILILIIGLFGVAQAQFAPTSAKTAFKWGVSIGTRDSTAYAANDSLVVVINRQGRMMYRSTDGYWKILSNAASSDYVPYTGAVTNVNLGNYRLTARSLKTDSIYANSSAGMYLTTNTGTAVAHWGGGGSVEVDFKGFAGYDANRASSYTARSFTDKNYVDSSDALRVRYTDTAAMLNPYLRKSDTASMLSPFVQYSDTTGLYSQVVRTFGTQTVGGNKTFSNDIIVNSINVGRGGGNVLTNTVLGVTAGISTTSGTENVFIGYESGKANTSGYSNVFLGRSSGFSNTTGFSNVFSGNSAGGSNTTGGANTSIGNQAGFSNVSSNFNTNLGTSAGFSNTAADNTFIGYASGFRIETGAQNTFLGSNSGTYINSGQDNRLSSNSVLLGYDTRQSANGNTNEIVIGHSARGNGSNTVTIGNSSVTGNYFNGSIFSTTNSRIRKTDGGTFGMQFYDANKGWFIGYKSSDADSLFQINYDGAYNTSLRNPLSINKNGQVYFINSIGVNTTTPSRLLDLRSSSINGTAINIGNSATNGKNYVVGSNFVAGNGEFEVYDADAAATRIRVSSGGDITMPGVYVATVGGTNRDVFVDNTGLIGYVSSFRASKKNIAPISNTDWLHKLSPVTFNYRVKDSLGNYTDSAYKELEYGLIAEEVETVNKEMVFYDVDSVGNKKLRGVHYSKLIIPLLAEIQEHKKRLDAQDKIIEALLTRIIALEAKFN